jgi:hypothetical protein
VATTGDGAKGLSVVGAGSSITASDLTVTTSGTVDSAGKSAAAVHNGSSPGTPYTSGGTLSLTDVTVQTSGANSNGVLTRDGGVTTISGGSV